MMSLLKKIDEDLVSALKGGDFVKVGVLRMAKTAFKNKEIEKKSAGKSPDLEEEEVIILLNKEVKKRKEAIDLYNKGNRRDLVEKESGELSILEEYLPKMLDEKEVDNIVSRVLQSGNFSSKDFGRVMKMVMGKLAGKAEGSVVSRVIKERLQ